MNATAAGTEFRKLIRLAAPIALAQAGTQVMGVVDLAVLGRVGRRELGAAGLGTGIFFFAAVIGMGLVMGVDPMISQALGAKDELRARHVLWQGIWIALGITVALTIPLLMSPAILPFFKIELGVQQLTKAFILVRTAGLAPLLLFLVARAYLQGHHITRPMVVAMLIGNVFNFLSDLLLVFGGASLPFWLWPLHSIPPLGVVGAAISTDLGSFLQLAIVAAAVRSVRLPPHDPRALQRPNRFEIAQAVHVGSPVGLQMGAEVGIFALVGLIAGRLGALELAAHQLVLSLASLTYTIAVGFAIAASVRVGVAIGARNQEATRTAGFVAIASGMCWMSMTAMLFAFAPRQMARIVSNQPDVIASAMPLLLVAAFFQIADGVQAVAAGALRGAGDTRFSLLANLVGYWVIAFPIGIYLAFVRSMGVVGLWWGLCAGLITVAALLFFRFDRLSSEEIVPIGTMERRLP